MIYDDPDFGFSLSLPDGTPPEVQQAHVVNLQRHYAGQAQAAQQAQDRYNALGWMGQVVSDAMAPPTQFAPVIDRRAAAAMTPQAMQQTAGMMQQGAQFQQGQQMQQQRMQQMDRIEQERMRQRNAEILQQQKDQKQMFQIRKQDYEMRKQEMEFQQKIREDDAKRKEQEAERREQIGDSYPTPGGGRAQVTYDSDGRPIVNEFIKGRPMQGGTTGRRIGQWFWDETLGRNVYKELNPETGQYEIPAQTNLTPEEILQQQTMIEQQEWDKGLADFKKRNIGNEIYDTPADAEATYEAWMGKRPVVPIQQYGHHSGYGSGLPPNMPTPTIDFNAMPAAQQQQTITPEIMLQRGAIQQEDGSFIYNGTKVILKDGQMYIEE